PRDLLSFPTRRSSDLQVAGFSDLKKPCDMCPHELGQLRLNLAPIRFMPKRDSPTLRQFANVSAQPFLCENGLLQEFPLCRRAQPDRKSTRLNSSHVKI